MNTPPPVGRVRNNPRATKLRDYLFVLGVAGALGGGCVASVSTPGTDYCGGAGQTCCSGRACAAGLACGGGVCGAVVSGRAAYDACAPGEACSSGTSCTTAMYSTTGAPGTLCTIGCTDGAQCPISPYGSAYLPTCIVSASVGSGLCYDTCVTDVDCGGGTTCATVPGTTARVCVPTTGSTAARGAYEACAAGEACTSGTVCTTAMYTVTGTPGTLCTIGCTDGAQCPVSPYGSAYLPTCIVSASVGSGLCYDTCVTNADCGGGTACATVPGTTARVCVPAR